MSESDKIIFNEESSKRMRRVRSELSEEQKRIFNEESSKRMRRRRSEENSENPRLVTTETLSASTQLLTVQHAQQQITEQQTADTSPATLTCTEQQQADQRQEDIHDIVSSLPSFLKDTDIVSSLPSFLKDTTHAISTFTNYTFRTDRRLIFTGDIKSLYKRSKYIKNRARIIK